MVQINILNPHSIPPEIPNFVGFNISLSLVTLLILKPNLKRSFFGINVHPANESLVITHLILTFKNLNDLFPYRGILVTNVLIDHHQLLQLP